MEFVGDYRYIRYETLDDGVIARITLDYINAKKKLGDR